MSKQPSERAFDVASEWHGHQLKCSIYHAPGRDDADCTCIVRDLALAIDAAIASARREAVEECERIARGLYTGPHKSVPLGVPGMGYRNTCGDRIADEIAALAAQEAKDALASKGKRCAKYIIAKLAAATKRAGEERDGNAT